MPENTGANNTTATSRRDFLKHSTTAAVGGALIGNLAVGRAAHAAGSDVLKIGLVGCGGRGGGAAANALNADPHSKLTAVADVFADRLAGSLQNITKQYGDRVDVPVDRQFVGFDAYQKLIDTDVDVVLLATPPHFRPAHFQACIDADKHVFVEKPVAVDAPGVRRVLEAVEKSQEKNLSVVSGLCWRYDFGVRETMKRVLDGAIGEIVAIQENYNAHGLWHRMRKDHWSDMEWQMRNWLYFTWLSGDHNVEQHVHSLDKASWLMGEEPPISASGLGGRQVRTDPKYGHIFDHHAVVYEYANGVRLYSFCRQQDGCTSDVSDQFLGTKGICDVLRNTIRGETNWRYRGPKSNMYDQEHKELFAGIRSGNILNNGLYMARSTMLAIMGRMATYTGKKITWEEAIHSQEDLTPASYEWGPLPTPPVAMPGITPFV